VSKTLADKVRIHLGRYLTEASAAAAGITMEQLQSFLEGTCELTEAEIKALARTIYIETGANLQKE
jgi:hypothetical protein